MAIIFACECGRKLHVPDKMAGKNGQRSEEHTSELQSHSFISYAVFCSKKKKQKYIVP